MVKQRFEMIKKKIVVKSADLTNDGAPMLSPGLLPILNSHFAPGKTLAEILEAFVEAECTPFLLAEERLKTSEGPRLLAELAVAKEAMNFDFLVCDPIDKTFLKDAVGAHLTKSMKTLAALRAEHGPDFLLGYTVHSLAEARQAEEQGATYLILAPIFASPQSSSKNPPLGLDALEDTVHNLTIPVFAMGGIAADNLIQVRDAGAYGFAVQSALYRDGEIEHNALKLRYIWDDLG